MPDRVATSGQPAFAPLVMLDVLEALAAFAADAKIEFLDVFVFTQRFGLTVEDNPARFENVAVGRRSVARYLCSARPAGTKHLLHCSAS